MRMFLKSKICIFVLLLSFISTSLYALEFNWQEFESEQGSFKIQIPGKLEFKQKDKKTSVGIIQENIFTFEIPDWVFTVEYSDLPLIALGSKFMVYKKTKKSFLEEEHGKQLSFEKKWHKLSKGRELVYESLNKKGKVRFFLVGTRLYVIQVAASKHLVDLEIFDKFLDSFKQEYKKELRQKRRRMRKLKDQKYEN